MSDKRKLIQKYFQLLETFSSDQTGFKSVLHPELVQTEYPNLINKAGQERGLEGCLRGAEAGKKLLTEQHIEISNAFESGNQMSVEAVWTGRMATDAGHLRKGQELKAFLCMVFEFKDGKIFRQRNYDCYEPFK